MKLTDKQLIEFQELYYQSFGIEISKEKALEEGTRLITLVKTISDTLNNYYNKNI